jgi:hypothetical protein
MKFIAKSFVLAFVVLFVFTPFVSAQPSPIYLGQTVEANGTHILGSYGNLYTMTPDGYRSWVAGTVSDDQGNLWIVQNGEDALPTGMYDLAVSNPDYLMVRRAIIVVGDRVAKGGGLFVMKPGMKDTGMTFDYNPQTRELRWSLLVRGRIAYSPVLRIETIVWSPAVTQEYTQFSVRQELDYGSGSYENKVALESLKGMSLEEQEVWHPSDAGLEAPKASPKAKLSKKKLEYANYIQLPSSLPAGQFVCGQIIVSRAGDPTNVRSNKHSFCARLEPKGFVGSPIVYVN